MDPSHHLQTGTKEPDNPLHFCSKCDSKFSNRTEFKTHNLQEYCTNILALDENCMDTIFKYLTPNDLAAMSSTCSKRYKELAERYFYLNCETEPIYIGTTEEYDLFHFKSSEEYAYEKRFSSLIRSIYYYNDIMYEVNPFVFIQNYCAKHLKLLKLRCKYCNEWGSNCYEMNGKIIENQLKHLEELQLTSIILNDLYDALLKYCAKLRVLTIFLEFYPQYSSNDDGDNYGIAWINQIYSNLESLTLCVPDEINIDLSNLLKLNQNLKKIICSNRSAIKSICQTESKLEYVAFLFFPEEDEKHFLNIQHDIVNWCKWKYCKCLELSIRFRGLTKQILRTVINLQNVIALHIRPTDALTIPMDLTASNITKLCIDFKMIPFNDKFIDELNDCFPNLKEIILNISTHQLETTFKEYALPIVGRFKYLNSFKLINWFEMTFSDDDITELNQIRSHLKDASDLIISLSSMNFNKLKSIASDQSIVKIQLDDQVCCTICYYSYNQDVSYPCKIHNKFNQTPTRLGNLMCRDEEI